MPGYLTKEEVIHGRRLELIKEIQEFTDYIQDALNELLYRVDPDEWTKQMENQVEDE